MSEQLVVEVKLRRIGDGMNWELRPVVATFTVVKDGGRFIVELEGGYKIGLSTCAKAIAIEEDADEVRWNFQGSSQGHYHII